MHFDSVDSLSHVLSQWKHSFSRTISPQVLLTISKSICTSLQLDFKESFYWKMLPHGTSWKKEETVAMLYTSFRTRYCTNSFAKSKVFGGSWLRWLYAKSFCSVTLENIDFKLFLFRILSLRYSSICTVLPFFQNMFKFGFCDEDFC